MLKHRTWKLRTNPLTYSEADSTTFYGGSSPKPPQSAGQGAERQISQDSPKKRSSSPSTGESQHKSAKQTSDSAMIAPATQRDG